MLRYRLASAIVLIPVIVGSVILGGLVFLALVVALVLLAAFEFYQMAEHAGYQPNFLLGLALIALLLLDAFLGTQASRTILMAGVVLALTVSIFRHGEGWILGWALTFAGVLYIGVLGAHFLLIRRLPDGQLWTAIVLLGAWATDTFAYMAGTNWGRHGFFTSISPKKTWEGAIGGEVACIVSIFILGVVAGLPWWHSLILGVGVGIASTIGDLAESVIKRQLGAKDSGALVPGHGGLLDRTDSLFFAAVFGYYYLAWIAHV